MSTGPTGPNPDEFNCECRNGDKIWNYSVQDCGECATTCRDYDSKALSICTPNSPSFIIFLIVFFIIMALLIIGYYTLWFFAINSTVKKLSSSKTLKSKTGTNGLANLIIVILFIIGALLSFIHPFSGMSFIFFLIIGVFIYSGGKSNVKPKKTKSFMISLSQV